MENPDIAEAIKSQNQAYMDLFRTALNSGLELKYLKSVLESVLGDLKQN
jgi:hypothetical protein